MTIGMNFVDSRFSETGLGSILDLEGLNRENLRFHIPKGFPNHLILYRECNDGVEIVRILHGSRNLTDILNQDETV